MNKLLQNEMSFMLQKQTNESTCEDEGEENNLIWPMGGFCDRWPPTFKTSPATHDSSLTHREDTCIYGHVYVCVCVCYEAIDTVLQQCFKSTYTIYSPAPSGIYSCRCFQFICRCVERSVVQISYRSKIQSVSWVFHLLKATSSWNKHELKTAAVVEACQTTTRGETQHLSDVCVFKTSRIWNWCT